MNEVMSFKKAIDAGYNPRFYKYGDDLPLGIYQVELDFKIWAKQSTPAVTCFCKIVETDEKIRFNIFRDHETGHFYHLHDTVTDMRAMEYGTIFTINVFLNKKGNRVVTGLN